MVNNEKMYQMFKYLLLRKDKETPWLESLEMVDFLNKTTVSQKKVLFLMGAKDDNVEIRKECIARLGDYKDSETTQFLIELLNDPIRDIRERAQIRLYCIDKESISKYLSEYRKHLKGNGLKLAKEIACSIGDEGLIKELNP